MAIRIAQGLFEGTGYVGDAQGQHFLYRPAGFGLGRLRAWILSLKQKPQGTIFETLHAPFSVVQPYLLLTHRQGTGSESFSATSCSLMSSSASRELIRQKFGEGGVRKGASCKFVANCAPNLRKIACVSSWCIRRRVHKIVANSKIIFGQFYANTPFPMPPSPKFWIRKISEDTSEKLLESGIAIHLTSSQSLSGPAGLKSQQVSWRKSPSTSCPEWKAWGTSRINYQNSPCQDFFQTSSVLRDSSDFWGFRAWTLEERERERERRRDKEEEERREIERERERETGWRKRGVEFKGGSRHDLNGRLFALHFVGQAQGGQGALQNRQSRRNRQNHHEGYPLNPHPLFPCMVRRLQSLSAKKSTPL